MSTLEVIGLFFVIFSVGIVVLVSLLSVIVAATVIYRWAARGKKAEDRELAGKVELFSGHQAAEDRRGTYTAGVEIQHT